MFGDKLKKFMIIFRSQRKSKLEYEAVKICLTYLIIGLLWIYITDLEASKISIDNGMLLLISTYKGWLYVFITTLIIYMLIKRLIKKVDAAETKLNKSNEELAAANEELQAYVQQLTASEEELRIQYEQIAESERKLAASEEKNKAIVNAIPDLLFVIDDKGYFLDCTSGDEGLLLVPKIKFIGKSISELMPEDVAKNAMEKLALVIENGKLQTFQYKLDISGKEHYFEVRMVKSNDKEVLAISRNMTVERRNELALIASENNLKYLSYHDQLTGLHNRRFFEEKLRELDKEENLPLTIIMADVNGLKLINDSFGHVFGDKLLIKVAELLKKACIEGDVLARLSGDEFIILLPKTDCDRAENIVKYIESLELTEKINSIDISVSFGYATKKEPTERISDILKKSEDNMYKIKLFQRPSMRGKTINTIISTLHEKNKREEQHSHRVSNLCEAMGRALQFPEDRVRELKTVGLLHDIGKIAIEENILNKNGKLTENEWNEIKQHPEIGYRILSTVSDMQEIAQYVLAHHERWDGKGYPRALKSEEIPLQARIISIADAYDAMVSERSYRDALPEEVAIEELKRNAGTQFDATLLDIFIEKVLYKSIC
ncbi:diguanylate cyclase [Clostridium sp. 19966]|uniref:HD domain-containing phosphohydrolase n=1 Tax=Clostridium sp. 19966 TaxID=2768166 RepID=UPI0028E05E4C|nr:HD domain-containing phosphohydrolase [Clostridium sp. 19966]MDT8719260.1 diguanylate cyclase [Clostridium sp. 19966]